MRVFANILRYRWRTAFTFFTLFTLAAYFTSGWFHFTLRGNPSLVISHGGIAAIWTPAPWSFNGFLFGSHHFGLTNDWSFFGYAGGASRGAGFEMALWPFPLLLIAANIAWFIHDHRRRPRPGFCRHCNYDLRATPDRCPECGTIAKQTRPM